MEPGDIFEITIERLSAGGDGLAFKDGKAVFVPFVAPGDRAVVRVIQEKSDFIRTELRSLGEASADRTEPTCAYYGTCGGCNLMHLGYEAQLAAKAGIVEDALRRTGKIEGARVSIDPSPPFGYRNRAQFHLTADKKPGYSRRSSAEILPIQTCPILVDPLRAWLEASATGESAWKSLKPFMAGKDRFLAFGDPSHGVGGRAYIEGPDGELTVTIAGKPIRFHIRGFFQSNLAMLDRLIPEVTAGVSGERAADLYCGVGLFGSFLKERFERVVCVEQDPRSVGYACANVGKPADFAASTMEEWTQSAQAKYRYDHVVVDPPRSGLASQVKAWLAWSKPESIGYVSCDPVSLARDAGELSRAGYDLESAKAFDFYPQTSHIEAYARFRLR